MFSTEFQRDLTGKKSTCRLCGKEITYDPGLTRSDRRHIGYWLHEGETRLDEPEDHVAVPKDFCMEWIQSSGNKCSSPVKHEDVKAENYACGRHMREWLEAKKRHAAEQERRRKNESRRQRDIHETEHYARAVEWLRENVPWLAPALERWERPDFSERGMYHYNRRGYLERELRLDIDIYQLFKALGGVEEDEDLGRDDDGQEFTLDDGSLFV